MSAHVDVGEANTVVIEVLTAAEIDERFHFDEAAERPALVLTHGLGDGDALVLFGELLDLALMADEVAGVALLRVPQIANNQNQKE